MLGELIPCGGGDPIPLLKKDMLIGRRSSCDISLRFPNISSHHCQLELVNGYWSVRDLGSTNGIKVNGVRVDQKWLMPGDVLSVAKHRFEIMYEPANDGPPPEERDPFAMGLLEKAGLARHRNDEPAPRKPQQPVDPDELELDFEVDESDKLKISDDDVLDLLGDD